METLIIQPETSVEIGCTQVPHETRYGHHEVISVVTRIVVEGRTLDQITVDAWWDVDTGEVVQVLQSKGDVG